MDKRQIGLSLALKELGLSSSVSGFDNRLVLQKTVYLLEEAGIKLGYSFNWYLRGPYSPALTRDLYDLASSNDDVVDWILDNGSSRIIAQIKPLVSGKTNEDLPQKARRLELLASLLYLWRRCRLDVDNPEKATKQLAKNGKDFPTHEVADALRGLKDVTLLQV